MPRATASVERVTVPNWRLPTRTPRVVIAQIAARYAPALGDDLRLRHAADEAYDQTLLSLLKTVREQPADFLIFPEYAWPARLGDGLHDTLSTELPANTACVLPFEHLTVEEFESVARALHVPGARIRETLRDVRSAIARSEEASAVVNVAFVALRTDRLKVFPQLKLRPAGMEETGALGRWRFAPGRTRLVFKGSNVAFSVAICFDFIAREQGEERHLRDALRGVTLDLLFVPECNPAPFHSAYARGLIELTDTPVWSRAQTKVVFANVAKGTSGRNFIQPAFGYSRCYGNLGQTRSPIDGVFAQIDGVVACTSPASLREVQTSREHLSLPDRSTVVARPHESLVAIQFPTTRAPPTRDVAAGRIRTEVSVYRPIEPRAGEWAPIHASAQPAPTTGRGTGIPQDYLVDSGLVGNEAAAAALDDALRSGATPVWVVGEGGSGKTALVADHLYREYVRSGTARVAWLDMAVVGASDDALRDELLAQLRPGMSIVVHPEKRWATIEQELRSAVTVVVLDSYELGRQGPVPVPLSAAARWPSRVVITSRRQPTDSGETGVVRVEQLSPDASGRLLIREAGGVFALEDVPELVALADGSPLTCTWLGHYVRDHSERKGNLLSAIRRGTISDKESFFEWLFADLSELERDLLSVLAHLRAPISLEHVATVLHRSPEEVSEAASRLRRSNLAMALRDGHSDLHTRHPFVRQFWDRHAPAAIRHATDSKILAWAEAEVMTHGGDRNWAEYRALDAQWPNLRFVLDRLAAAREDRRFLMVWRGVDYFLWTTGRYPERIVLGKLATEAAERTGDKSLLAHALYDSIAESLWHVDPQSKEVEGLFARAEGIYKDIEDARGLAMVAYYRSRLYRDRRQIDLSRKEGERALSLAQSAGADLVVALAHNALGSTERLDGRYEPARQHYESALAFFQSVNDVEMLGVVRRNLGLWELARGRWGKALVHFEDAIRRFRDLNIMSEVGEAALNHARALARLGELDEAAEELDAAALILDLTSSRLRGSELAEARAELDELRRNQRPAAS